MNRVQVEERLTAATEALAQVEHDRWSRWQKYMHGVARRMPDGSLVIPADLVSRWDRQLAAPYEALSESEKESDREQVRKYLPVVADYICGPL